MSNELEKMYQTMFDDRGLTPCPTPKNLNPVGKTYAVSKDMGDGYCRVYRCNEYLSITIMDVCYYNDRMTELVQPDFICIGYYYSVSGEMLLPYRRLFSGMLQAYVGNRGKCKILHHKGVPLRSISVTIMPEYYEEYLREKFSEHYENPRDAFASIDGISDFPEVVTVFNRIRDYTGKGMAAKLFYEGKVDEILSLILEKAKTHNQVDNHKKELSEEDSQAISQVAFYLNEHYAKPLEMKLLTQIACMSLSKLKYCFKSQYNCSIRQYIQNARMSQAEHLLLYTDIPLSQIASAIGYIRPGSFSEVFKQHTGVTPAEFRQYRKRI